MQDIYLLLSAFISNECNEIAFRTAQALIQDIQR